jgi:hypothetical protein
MAATASEHATRFANSNWEGKKWLSQGSLNKSGPLLFGVGSRRPKTICGADSGSPLGRKETAQDFLKRRPQRDVAATKGDEKQPEIDTNVQSLFASVRG